MRAMAALKDVGERSLIRNVLNRINATGDNGPGDDAALLDVRGRIAVSSDSLTFARHMPPGTTYEEFGWMAAAVNFSDIASMGARPIGIVVSLMLPEDMDETALYDMMDGIDQCAEFCGTTIIGGDTKVGEGAVCCTALGSMDGRRPMRRSGANVGDMIAVTGPLGSAAAGYHALINGRDEEDAVRSLRLPIPRVEEGIMLSEVATSCMDISDGLSTSLNEICRQSGVGADVLWSSLPIGPGVDAMSDLVPKEHMMLHFGGEYELLFTFGKDDIGRLHEMDVDFTIIGSVNDSGRVMLLRDNGREVMDNGGYEHFKD